MKKIILNQEKLTDLVNLGLTIPGISKEMSLSIPAIVRGMQKFGLKSKSLQKKYEKIECSECHKIFKSLKTNKRKFCSRNCSLNHNKKILQENREIINKKISQKLKKIDSNGVCLYCHSDFLKQRKNSIYCSRRCKSKHLSNLPENKERVSRFFSKLTKKRHEEGDCSIGWQSRNKLKLSYPEKLTFDYMENNNIDFERELKVGKYFIDFAFINKKIALEIDGRTHDDIEVIEKDTRKNDFLKKRGWIVYRIKWVDDNKHFDRLKAFIVQMGLEQ